MKKMFFALVVVSFCFGFFLGENKGRRRVFHSDDIIQIGREILEKEGGCSQQDLEDVRACSLRLLDEVYFRGDVYHYSYDPLTTEVLLCLPLEYELSYFSRSMKKGEPLPRFVFDHIRGYIKAMPVAEPTNKRKTGVEACGIVGLLNECKRLDKKGFDELMSTQADSEYMREVVEAMRKLNDHNWQ